jgi:hypothetical protein
MAAEARTTIAQHRQADDAKLIGLISGDLGWIVMKALEKDRTRRYETANGLTLDIKRHLDSEPVLARLASTLYRFRRLVRRNKLAFNATTAVAVALVVGIGISTWQAVEARKAQRVTEVARTGEQQQRLEALAQARKASGSEQQSRRLLYASDMTSAECVGGLSNCPGWGKARRQGSRRRLKDHGWRW